MDRGDNRTLKESREAALRGLPGVDRMLLMANADPFFEEIPKQVLLSTIRRVLDAVRKAILGSDMDPATFSGSDITMENLMNQVKRTVRAAMTPNLKPVVNATGVVVHTNLGRSILAREATENISCVASVYSNLEFDLALGERGLRYSSVESLICEISGAEAAMAVNNNAGAVLLCLDTLARGKQAIVSRGELVEIGGSFRVPDVMAKSGAILKEVGTTNRTHYKDYADAIGEDTGLLMKVHASNYSIVGFTSEVPLKALVTLGRERGIPVMQDLGSGTFIDFSQFGLVKEPTVQESVSAGVDVVTFSGDKLLGGPQAGIIVGKRPFLDCIKRNPLTRALRIDKLTLAALEATLRLYRDPYAAVARIPTLNMLTTPIEPIVERTETLLRRLTGLDARLLAERVALTSKAGGGSLPLMELPSQGIRLQVRGMSANAVEKKMRAHQPPVIGRIEGDAFIMDMRTVQDDDLDAVHQAVSALLDAGEGLGLPERNP